jgi:hypothetical protein
MEEDLEEITKDWLEDLLIPANLAEMFDSDRTNTTQKEHDTPRPSRTKKIEEVQYLRSAS